MSDHAHTKQVVDRLARVEGHVGAIRRMVSEGRPCTDVLVQIAAARSGLLAAARVLLADHMETCVVGSLRDGDIDTHLKELREALDRFIA